MNNEWDEYAEGWDTDPTVIEYAQNAFKALTAQINLNNLSVFDFGCGTGALTEIISSRVKLIVALDASPKMIDILKAKNLKNVLTIPDYLSRELIDNNPALNQQFDLIIASSACSFLPDYASTLTLLKGMLKSSGVFVQWDWLASSENTEVGFTENLVKKTLLQSGFSDIKITSPFVMQSSEGNMPVMMVVANNA